VAQRHRSTQQEGNNDMAIEFGRKSFGDDEELMNAIGEWIASDDGRPNWPYLVIARTPDEDNDWGFRFIFGSLYGNDNEYPPLVADTIHMGCKITAHEYDLESADWQAAEIMIADMSRVEELGPIPMVMMPAGAAVMLHVHHENNVVAEAMEELDDDAGVPAEWINDYGSGNGQGGYL